jgi:hypothetical protein
MIPATLCQCGRGAAQFVFDLIQINARPVIDAPDETHRDAR